MLTSSQLIACGIAPTQANTFVDPLNAAMQRFDITGPARMAAFLGQCMVESSLLVHTEEILFYSHPENAALVYKNHFPTPAAAVPYLRDPVKMGNFVYALRHGNGDEASGDGYLFRGRGLLQITGRDAYADAANGLAHDYVNQPDLVALAPDACLTAAWFWHTNKLNALADAAAVDAITRAVNGVAMLEAGLRQQFTNEALRALTP